MKQSKKGNIWIILGLVLIVAALFLTGYNWMESRQAGEASFEQAAQLEQEIEEKRQDMLSLSDTQPDIPDYQINPDMDMPTKKIEGIEYIGILEIPTLGLKLPVAAQLTYPHLRKAPCCYEGTIYQNNMVVAAHNYQSHFGNIKNMQIGDTVLFTDMDGNTFSYQMVGLEILQPTDIEGMKAGDCDLTLFTCTLGGAERVTVRLERTADLQER